MSPMYGVASETSTVARSRRAGHAVGSRRIAKAPGPVAHAVAAGDRALCGADVSGLLRWPDFDFDFADVDPPSRCPECAAAVE
jgi:hypothetical protein